MTKLTLDDCMDILDWFDDSTYDYIQHILLSKLGGEERVKRALPELRKRARHLLKVHAGAEDAYPENNLGRAAGF